MRDKEKALRSIRVETSGATVLLTEAPEPKVKDRQTGEALMRLGVVYIDGGESSLLLVTVPESGVTEGLALGSPVTLIGLIARPWETVFNGQQRHGIAFRADAIAPAEMPVGAGV